MPELPEVEVLVRHLAPLVRGKTIRNVTVRRERVIRPTALQELRHALRGARIVGVRRRAKFFLFELRRPLRRESVRLVGHLGMTGRVFLAPKRQALPKHAAVVLELGQENLVYEDARYFGRFSLDASSLAKLGPEPLSPDFTVDYLVRALKRSARAIKIKLLDQTLVAGIGNIYASEALHRARLSPRRAARSLTRVEAGRLHRAIRKTLAEAIRFGSTVPLNFGGRDGLFYYGRAEGAPDFYEERLRVYDRAGQACRQCGVAIRRIVQAARSTYYCPGCQR
ncbi:MAG TPA: bifunctional DNA-formamidopyrimidine glycosylase/DNA-(apurinic or apyrimidinic site) lyase [Verrucomicrobiae bacterium]